MRWLRRLARRYMRPMHEYDAYKWKNRVALIYAFGAWNALGVVIYQMWHKKADWSIFHGLATEEERDKRPSVHYAEVLGVKKAKIIRISGFEVIDETTYVEEEEKSPFPS